MPGTLAVRQEVARPVSRTVAIGTARSEFDHVMLPRTGLQLPSRLPFEKWIGIGQRLAALSTSTAWCLGDWIVYGEDAYSGRYRDAIEQTSLDYQTLRNYAWVVRRFPQSRRRDKLSFGHHAEVTALMQPEQDFWLRKAEELGWSRNRLRREVRASLSQRQISANPCEIDARGEAEISLDELKINVKLTPEQGRLCNEAAAREGLSLESWAASILEKFVRHNGNLGRKTHRQLIGS